MWDTLKIFKHRIRQGYRTSDYPKGLAELPERFRGRLQVAPDRCAAGCAACAEACPTRAIRPKNGSRPFQLDLGRCIFCTECVAVCPEKAIEYSRDHRLASTSRDALVLTGAAGKDALSLPAAPGASHAATSSSILAGAARLPSRVYSPPGANAPPEEEARLAKALDEKMRKLFKRSLKLRQVSAGGCGGCEAELAALGNVVFDLSRFGIQFVASPRHADGIVITGPVTENMREALRRTFDAVPAPKLVIAVGACAISGGPFVDSPQTHDGASSTVSVDLFIPGCPPHPLTILDGLLRLLGRLE